MVRRTTWKPPTKTEGINVQNFIKNHSPICVIGVLLVVILYQVITSRRDTSRLEADKKQLVADLTTARGAEQDAIARLGKIQAEYNALKPTVGAISDGIAGATDAATNSTNLIIKLKNLVGQLPERCQYGNLKP